MTERQRKLQERVDMVLYSNIHFNKFISDVKGREGSKTIHIIGVEHGERGPMFVYFSGTIKDALFNEGILIAESPSKLGMSPVELLELRAYQLENAGLQYTGYGSYADGLRYVIPE